LGLEFLTLLNGWGIFKKASTNSQMMINNTVPKVNPALKTSHSRISIEIRPKIIYVDTVRFVFLAPDIP
jgi:hypothetical protein